MKHGKGSDLPGMTQSQGAHIGVIYVSPDDDRTTVLAAILAEEKHKREQIVIVLPQKNKAFQRPEDFDDLKMRRRKFQAELIFVTPAGPGPADFARQRRFAVFSTIESFVRSFTTSSTSQSDQSPQPNNRSGKKGLLGNARNAVAGATGFAAGRAAANPPAQRRRPRPRPASGLTPSSDITDQPTQQQAPQRPPASLRPTPQPPQTPPPQSEDAEDQGIVLLPPSSIRPADTVDEHEAETKTDIYNIGLLGAAGPGAEPPAADAVLHTPPPGQGTGPDSNIDKDDDDWDTLPPAQGQPMPSALPNTPAATSAGTGRRKPTNPPIDPNPIVFPMPSGTTPKGPKPTKKLPEAMAGTATQAPPPSTPSTTTNGNTGKAVAAGAVGAAAGAMAVRALTNNTTNTGKTPTVPVRAVPAPARNAGSGHTLTPAGSISAVSAGWPPPGGPMRSPRTPPPNRNRRAVIIIALVILVLLMICGLTVSANPGMTASMSRLFGGNPPVTVTITPANQTVQDTYLIQGVTSNANPANRQVTVRPLSSTKTATDTVNATGHGQTQAKTAIGTLMFVNGSTSPETIAPTVITSSNGIQVIANQNVTIPGRNNQTLGTATVDAHAVSPGTNGNIAAGSINTTCCLAGGFITVTNQNAFSGGQDAQDYHFLQTSDVNTVTNAHQATLKSDAQKDINGQVKSGEQLLGTINCADPKTTADQTIGDTKGRNITSANVTVSVSCNVTVFDAKAMQTIAQNALQQKASKDLGAGYVLAGNTLTEIQSLQDGVLTFTVTAKGIWYYQWTDANKQTLLNKIKGQTKAQAQTILNTSQGVANAKININNGATTLPSDINQIKLDVQPVKGLPGGNNPIPILTPIPTLVLTPIPTPTPTDPGPTLGS